MKKPAKTSLTQKAMQAMTDAVAIPYRIQLGKITKVSN